MTDRITAVKVETCDIPPALRADPLLRGTSWEGRGRSKARKQQKVNALTRGDCRRLCQCLSENMPVGGPVPGPVAAEAARFLICTGLRLAEFLALKKADVFIEGRARPHIMVTGKGNVTRKVPLCREAQEAAATLKRSTGGRHPCLFPGGEAARRTLQRRFREAGKLCRIQFAVTPHILRHTFGSIMIAKGVQLPVVQDLLGHADIRTTRIYLTTSDDILKKAAQTLGKAIFGD